MPSSRQDFNTYVVNLADQIIDIDQNRTLELIKQLAMQFGQQVAFHYEPPTFFANANTAHAYRTLVVPLLYKLGLSQVAAALNQQTFEYLYPEDHLQICTHLNKLHGENWQERASKIMHQFFPTNIACVFSSRIKSTHSIWKKTGDVNDMLGIRWCVPLKKHENRFDASIRGVMAAPKESLIGFKNQFLLQSSKFSEEPVIKMIYQIEGFGVELQILGGNIDYYMSAKGYANYKTGFNFAPQKEKLPEKEWNARLGTLIHLQEADKITECRLLLLNELVLGKAEYNKHYSYIPETKPNHVENLNYQFEIAGKTIQPSTCSELQA